MSDTAAALRQRSASPRAANRLHGLAHAARHAAALLGGYRFAYGYVALATFGLAAAGMAFDEARLLAWMTGFIVLLVAVLWAYTPRDGWRPWLVLGGGGTVMSAAAWALSRAAG